MVIAHLCARHPQPGRYHSSPAEWKHLRKDARHPTASGGLRGWRCERVGNGVSLEFAGVLDSSGDGGGSVLGLWAEEMPLAKAQLGA